LPTTSCIARQNLVTYNSLRGSPMSQTEINLKIHVETLCQAPRVPQSPGYFAARKYLADSIRKIGFEPEYHDFFDIPAGACRNIYAEKGPKEGSRILLGAHYESIACSGVAADDNASAVALILEVFRQLPDSIPVTVVFFDVEENFGFGALHGSKKFSAFYRKPLAQVLIFDLVGGANFPGFEDGYFQFGNSLGRLENENLRFFNFPTIFLEPLGGLLARSDYRAFRNRGIPYTFISSGTPWYYHTEFDTPDRLDYKKMAGLVETLVKELQKAKFPKNVPNWKQWPEFIGIVDQIPGMNSDFLEKLKTIESPTRWQIIKLYKALLPLLRREREALWTESNKSLRIAQHRD